MSSVFIRYDSFLPARTRGTFRYDYTITPPDRQAPAGKIFHSSRRSRIKSNHPIDTYCVIRYNIEEIPTIYAMVSRSICFRTVFSERQTRRSSFTASFGNALYRQTAAGQPAHQAEKESLTKRNGTAPASAVCSGKQKHEKSAGSVFPLTPAGTTSTTARSRSLWRKKPPGTAARWRFPNTAGAAA